MFGYATVKKSSVQMLKDQLSDGLEVHKELRSTIEEMRVEMQGLRKKIQLKDEVITSLNLSHERLENNVRDLKIRNYDLEVDLEELQNQNSELEAQAKYQVKAIAELAAKHRKVRDEKGRFAPKTDK